MAEAAPQNTVGNGKGKAATYFKPGNPGKAPGTTNLLTRTVKQAVLEAFNELQGTEDYNLIAFATKYPRDFYAIAARLIPTDIRADIRVNKVLLEIERTTTTTANGTQEDPVTDITSEPTEGT